MFKRRVMFVARRKLVWLFTFLLLFCVLVMTVNHYLYMGGGGVAISGVGGVGGSNRGNGGNGGGGGRASAVEKGSFKAGEAAVDENDDVEEGAGQVQELTVQEEVNKNLMSKRIEYVDKMSRKNAAVLPIAPMVQASREEEDEMVDNAEEDEDEADTDPDGGGGGIRFVPRRRVVHFDLKGAPPKVSYFKAIFPLIKDAGATAIILEYEDMFPYWGELRNLSALNAYSLDEVHEILGLASSNGLDVIPLVQTFGHLEFALKLQEFRDLREYPQSPQAVCPSQDRGWQLVTQMLDQVLSVHTGSRWMHVGCDEVYQLAQCPICLRRELPARTIFLDHVRRVANYVRGWRRRQREQQQQQQHHRPHRIAPHQRALKWLQPLPQQPRRKGAVIPIVWDDMLRGFSQESLLQSGIGPLVEPMVWVYAEDVDRFVDPLAWSNFATVFRHVWTASAFKGAFGERLYAANIERHVANNLAWLEVMRRESQPRSTASAAVATATLPGQAPQPPSSISFRGIALTGWSRYDHFAVLCELLPVALPSLLLNLALLTAGGDQVTAAKKAHRLLQCGPLKAPLTQEELHRGQPEQWDLHRCKFPGANLLGLLSLFDNSRREVEALNERLIKRDGWVTDYNVRHGFSSAQRVSDAMRGVSYIPATLQSLRSQLVEALLQFFDEETADEWTEQNLLPVEKTVDDLEKRFRQLMDAAAENVWPRRPLTTEQTATDNDGANVTVNAAAAV